MMLVRGLVLVVDDNAGFRNLASRILTAWGHNVAEAGTFTEALSQVADCVPQAALVDIGLPDGNGFDLARELLRLAPAVRVVIMSTDSDAGNVLAARRAGAVAFFAKEELSSPGLEQILSNG